MLNDRATGNVWDVDSDKPTRLDNWDAFRLKAKDENDDEDDQQQRPAATGGRRRPRTTTSGPGRAAPRSCTRSTTTPRRRAGCWRSARCATSAGSDATLAISPDGQTVQITLPSDAVGRRTSFEYFIDDGRQSVSAHATVRVDASPVRISPTTSPELREGFEPRVWIVPASGTIDVPVLPDWRDPQDGDPVSTVAASRAPAEPPAPTRASPRPARSRFHAPDQGGLVKVDYDVTDGLGAAGHREPRLPGPGAQTTATPSRRSPSPT